MQSSFSLHRIVFTSRLQLGHGLVTRPHERTETLPRSSFERPKGAPVSRRGIRLMVAVAAVSLLAALPAAAQAKSKIITISGSTSVFPLETQLARKWIKTKNGKGVGFRILQGGSNVGIDDVAHGRVSIGASSRDPAPATDPGGLVFTKIARDAICLIVNNKNNMTNIDTTT